MISLHEKMMLQQICIVMSLILVQHCLAQKFCGKASDCTAPAYIPDVCDTINAPSFCQCSTGWRADVSVCNPPAPTISRVPNNAVVYLSENYTLTCDTTVTGSDITYRWFKDTNDLNKNTQSLAITSAQSSNSGAYACKITVAGGSTESLAVTLTFQTPAPTISRVPNDAVVYLTESYTLTCDTPVTESGVTFAWFKDTIDLNNNIPSLAIKPAHVSNNGAYTCKITVAGRSAESSAVTLTFQPPAPTVSGILSTEVVYLTESYTLFCETAVTENDVTFAWLKNSADLNKNTQSLAITSAQSSNNGAYTCKITVAGRSAESSAVNLTFQTPAPTISRVPSNAVVYLSKSYTLTCDTPVTESGVTFAWLKDSTDLNKNTQSLTITSAQASNNGAYTCKLTVAGRSAESSAVTLSFISQGKACSADTDCVVTDVKGYTGKCVSSYCECAAGYIAKEDKCQAQKTCSQETKDTDCTAPAYAPGVCLVDAGVSVCQCATGWTTAENVCNPPAPTINGAPCNAVVYLKESYTLTCSTTVTGSDVTYSWFKDSTDLNKNTQSLAIRYAQVSDSGTYKCKITIAGGSAESAAVTLSVKSGATSITASLLILVTAILTHLS